MHQPQRVSPQPEGHAGNLATLHEQLERLITSNSVETSRVLNICERILVGAPLDAMALKTKAIALMLAGGRLDNALASLEKLEGEARLHSTFERAYCLYRCGRFVDAKRALEELRSAHPDLFSTRCKHLLAQSYFNTEEYDAAASLYQKMLDSSDYRDDEEKDEIVCNLSAALVYARPADGATAIRMASQPNFDLLNNAAAAKIETKDYDGALALLAKAEEFSRKQHGVPHCTVEYLTQCKTLTPAERAFFDEVSLALIQRAFVYCAQGKEGEAEALLRPVLNHKPTAVSTHAIACTNWAAIKRNADFFDTYRKLKQASSPQAEARMTPKQRLVVRYNTALLLLHAGKLSQCKSMVESLMKENPQSHLGPLALSALYIKEKKYGKAEESLKQHLAATAGATQNTTAQLTVVQMWLEQGNWDSAMANLALVRSMADLPGAVATRAEGYAKIGDFASAKKVVEEALASKGVDRDKLLKFAGRFYMRHEQYELAAAIFEKQLQANPSNCNAKAGLALALTHVDLDRAKRMAEELPAASEVSAMSSVRVDALESEPIPRSVLEQKGYRRAIVDSDGEGKAAAKKRRARPLRRPPIAGIDASEKLDPERWIPMRERTYIRDLPVRRQKAQGKRIAEERLQQQRRRLAERKRAEEALLAAASQSTTANSKV